MQSIQEHTEWFEAFAREKMALAQVPDPLILKLGHTREVLANAAIIEEKEKTGFRRPVLLAALYHDLARFDQYLDFGTFKDAESFNHGIRGVLLLKKLRRLIKEAPATRKIVYAAVGLHNRLALPPALSPVLQTACNIIRDADKLDILRVMHEHLNKPGPYNPTIVLSLPDEEGLHSPKVIEMVLNRRVPGYGDLRSVNDFRILLCARFYDMHFSASRKLFLERGHGLELLKGVPDSPPYLRVKESLLKSLNQHV